MPTLRQIQGLDPMDTDTDETKTIQLYGFNEVNDTIQSKLESLTNPTGTIEGTIFGNVIIEMPGKVGNLRSNLGHVFLQYPATISKSYGIGPNPIWTASIHGTVAIFVPGTNAAAVKEILQVTDIVESFFENENSLELDGTVTQPDPSNTISTNPIPTSLDGSTKNKCLMSYIKFIVIKNKKNVP